MLARQPQSANGLLSYGNRSGDYNASCSKKTLTTLERRAKKTCARLCARKKKTNARASPFLRSFERALQMSRHCATLGGLRRARSQLRVLKPINFAFSGGVKRLKQDFGEHSFLLYAGCVYHLRSYDKARLCWLFTLFLFDQNHKEKNGDS